MKSIGNYAFNSCSNLASVAIPESVTNIGAYSFYGTPWYDNQPDGMFQTLHFTKRETAMVVHLSVYVTKLKETVK